MPHEFVDGETQTCGGRVRNEPFEIENGDQLALRVKQILRMKIQMQGTHVIPGFGRIVDVG